MDLEHFKYTLKHKQAFLQVEKQLTGGNSIRGYLHDIDKLLMYLFPISSKKVSKLHRERSKHHIENAQTKEDITQAIIDWECARITKPDKPLNARETLFEIYPQYRLKVIPILNKLGL